ncbi:MAG: hypothetical protein ACLQNE_27115 [Thermoguttaceae bacterium]
MVEATGKVDFGDFYLLDLRRNLIFEKRVDPEELAQRLDVLKPWETVVNE